MIVPALARLNRLRIWRHKVRIGQDCLRATSFDRLVYLWYWRCRKSKHAEAAFLRSCLKPGMRVIDAGANLGVYSHFFARCVGPQGRVAAFEPDPVLFESLRASVAGNGLAQIEPHRLALSASSGRGRLSLDPFNAGDNHLVASEEGTSPGLEVAITTIDEFLGDAPMEFIKIDVQGWEPHVLRGMHRTLERNPQLQLYLEFSPYALARAGNSPADLFTWLTDRDFEFTILRDGNPAPASLDMPALAGRPLWFANVYARRKVSQTRAGCP